MIAGGNEKGVGGGHSDGGTVLMGGSEGVWGGGSDRGGGGTVLAGQYQSWGRNYLQGGGCPSPPRIIAMGCAQWGGPGGYGWLSTPPPIPPQGVCGAQCPQCKRSWLGGGGAMTPWGGGGAPLLGGVGEHPGAGGAPFPVSHH